LLIILLSAVAGGETHYVARNSTNPVSPFLTWETAAVEIQAAVDVATNGSTVLVTNGVYDTGGTPPNRVSITHAISVQSVNGPDVTVIDGKDSVRGVFMSNGGSLRGFTITRGDAHGQNGGGLRLYSGCTVSGCVISQNQAVHGGGVYADGILNNCILWGNRAKYEGGGAYLYGSGEINNSSVFENRATDQEFGLAGGIYLYDGGVYNCIIWGNIARDAKNLVNGGVVRNTCSENGVTDGVNGCIKAHPIFIDAANGDFRLQADSPCINAGDNTYAPAGGDLVGNARIQGGTVDMGVFETPDVPGFRITTVAGTNGAIFPSSPKLFQGEDQTFSIRPEHSYRVDTLKVDGATQTVAASYTFSNIQTTHTLSATFTLDVSTPLQVYVDASRPGDSGVGTNWATAKQTIQAGVDLVRNGGTVWVTNGVYDSGGRAAPGYFLMNRVCITRPLTVRSVNGPKETLIKGKGQVGSSAIRGVFMTNGCSLIGFTITNGHTRFADPFAPTGWEEGSAGGIWLSSGSTASNCTLTKNTADLRGGGAYLEAGSQLSGCVLSGNLVYIWGGGGAYQEAGSELNSCVLTGNRANNGDLSQGGGLFGGTAVNCTFIGNISEYKGGGIFGASAKNCTFFGNEAENGGGGAHGGALRNCIAWNNTNIYDGENNISQCSKQFSCAPDGLTHGANGNITNAPFFIDTPDNNLRLQSNSPCINAGNNSYVSTTNDLDNLPRIVGGVVDMGAYERQDAGSDVDADALPDHWEMTHFDSRHFTDPAALSSNGVDTLRDAYIAGFDPNDPGAAFLISILPDRILEWDAVSGRVYSIYCKTNLTDETYTLLQSNMTSGVFTNTADPAEQKGFYRVDVQMQQ